LAAKSAERGLSWECKTVIVFVLERRCGQA
jgi:hypothetical protein